MILWNFIYNCRITSTLICFSKFYLIFTSNFIPKEEQYESCLKNWGRWESLKLKIEYQWWSNYLLTLTRMIKEENLLLHYKNIEDSLKICIYIFCKNVCCANVRPAIPWKEFLTFCIPWNYQVRKEEKRDKYIITLESRICDILFARKKVSYGIKKNGNP